MKIKILYISLVTMGLMSSCYEDYLETPPTTDPLTSVVFSNVSTIQTLMKSAYQPMRWEFNRDFGDSYCMPHIYTDVRSDDIVLENTNFQPHSHPFENYADLSSTNINIKSIWAKFFRGVGLSNEVIRGLLVADKEVVSEEQINVLIAEARFLRAYYYFELVKNFGEVPLFGDEITDISKVENITRKPVEMVYAQIESDLIEASKNLPVAQGEKYRATMGAALALLSKVYLYEEKYPEAAKAAKDVVQLGIYGLEDDYADNFKISNEFGKESIFEISYTDDVSGQTFEATSLNSLSLQFFSPNLSPTAITGWNYNLTTPELLKAFNDEGDTERRDATIMLEGHEFNSPILQAEGFDPVPATMFDAINEPGRYGDDFRYSLKYFLTPEELEEYAPGVQESPLNQKVLRYAEVLLILAEASLYAPEYAVDGQDAFDEVRTRSDGLTKKTLTLEALKIERRLELATEWNRFHDLVRWGDAEAVLGPLGFTKGRDELLPIPLDEIKLTGDDENGDPILKQNFGY